MKIVPPNFGYVEENIFRCGAPEPRHFGFLSSLNLRTCVVLTDAPDEAFMRWMRESGVQIMCPLLSTSTGSTSSARRHGPGGSTGIDRDTASPRRGGRDGEAGRGGGGGDGEEGKLKSGGAGRAGDGGAGGSGGLDGTGNGAWPGFPTGTSEASRAALPSNAARFLKENNAYAASPVTRAEPSAAYMRNGSSVFFTDDVNPDVTNSIGRGLMTLPEPVVVSILQVVLDARYYPLLITCSKGRYRTGIVCGCLRKLQGWNLVSILEEYRRYAGNKSRAENEEYIELFDTDLVNVQVEGTQRPSILYGP